MLEAGGAAKLSTDSTHGEAFVACGKDVHGMVIFLCIYMAAASMFMEQNSRANIAVITSVDIAWMIK